METGGLKPFMAYSRYAGSRETAILVFAHNVREAKVESWHFAIDLCDGEWTDLAVNLLKEPQLYDNANKEKLAMGIPHVIDCPRSCKDCETWGHYLNDDGICEDCEQAIEDQKLTDEDIEEDNKQLDILVGQSRHI